MYEPLTKHQVHLGFDSRRMEAVASDSVHLVVTSPPYWQLKDYEHDRQIGFHDRYEDYINDLNLVWSECARVLHPGCRVAINIGDQFARASHYGRYKVIPIRTEIVRFFETMGLDHMGAIIWRKVTTCNSSGGGAVMGSFPNPRNGVLKLDYEFILLFKKPGKPPLVTAEQKKAAAMTTDEWNRYFAGHWDFPGDKQRGHVAAFPMELPRRLIRMFTFPEETVLDPFLGSATTMSAAAELGRSSIGYELNANFESHMAQRLGLDTLTPIASPEFQRAGEDAGVSDAALEELREGLPYRFVDPVPVERKVLRERHGSVFARGDKKRNADYRKLSKVEAGAIELDCGRRVRMLGVDVDPGKTEAAAGFLQEQIGGRKVILHGLREAQDGWAAYVLLPNRKNLNAHLIRRGLARPRQEEHPQSKRFERYATEAEDSGE
ncbi:MAG: DNA methyltransferase [Planctomycetota bacterium]